MTTFAPLVRCPGPSGAGGCEAFIDPTRATTCSVCQRIRLHRAEHQQRDDIDRHTAKAREHRQALELAERERARDRARQRSAR